jgi:hypothetical protein
MSTHFTNEPALMSEVKEYCEENNIDYSNTPMVPESISIDVNQLTQEHRNAISNIFDKYFQIKQ